MGFVAIGADDALLEHATLKERSVDVDFIQDLPIGVIEPLVQKFRSVELRQRCPKGVHRVHDGATTMTRGAGIELSLLKPRAAAGKTSGPGSDEKSFVGGFVGVRTLGPGNML